MKAIEELNFLIVDDDKPTRDKIVKNLRGLGFRGNIHQAENGEEGLSVLRDLDNTDEELDLIICDIVMPVKTGVEMLRDLRASSLKYAKSPFLMLTSKSDRQMVVTCVKYGVSQYLIKPWDAKTLFEKIHDCLKK